MIASLLRWENTYISALEAFLGEKIVSCQSKEAAREVLPEAEVIITIGGAPLFDEDLLSVCSRLRLILSISTGVEKLPLKALHEHQIAVCNTKGTQSASIAEHVIGCMLAVSHRIPQFIRNQDKKRWENVYGADLEGQTVCIIGAGTIGAEIGKKAKTFNMQVHGVKRYPAPMDHFDFIWGSGALREALPEADFIVVITPLTPATYHLLNTEEFRVMKDTAVVINVSRGQTIDEGALIDALRSGQIAGAVLDVFENEPLPPENPLWRMENVLITPHNAALTYNAERKITKLLCDNVARFRQGKRLINQIVLNELF